MIFTRGYVTDAFHTIALIPFCDLFNHSSTSAHTSLLSDQSVCPTCGSLRLCEHDPPGAERVAHLTSEYIDQTEKEGRNVEMRAETAIRRGEQIYSCYEEGLGNGKLLVEWGYISSVDDGLRWSAGEVLRREDGRAYLALWQRDLLAGWYEKAHGHGTGERPVGTMLYFPEDPGDFGLRPNGSLSVNVVLALLLQLDGPAGLEDVGDLEDAVIEVMGAINRGEAPGAGQERADPVCCGVQRLLQERLESLHPWAGTPEELAIAIQVSNVTGSSALWLGCWLIDSNSARIGRLPRWP
jgi:hypothetical protein